MLTATDLRTSKTAKIKKLLAAGRSVGLPLIKLSIISW